MSFLFAGGRISEISCSFCLPVAKEVVGRTQMLGMFAIERFRARYTMTDRCQADLIVFNRKDDLCVAVQPHRLPNRDRKDHATIPSHLNIYAS